jgi:hypothetical protein
LKANSMNLYYTKGDLGGHEEYFNVYEYLIEKAEKKNRQQWADGAALSGKEVLDAVYFKDSTSGRSERLAAKRAIAWLRKEGYVDDVGKPIAKTTVKQRAQQTPAAGPRSRAKAPLSKKKKKKKKRKASPKSMSDAPPRKVRTKETHDNKKLHEKMAAAHEKMAAAVRALSFVLRRERRLLIRDALCPARCSCAGARKPSG